MSSPWIQHVNHYRSMNPGLSYKDALRGASASYQSGATTGGKFRIPKNMSGAKKLVRQGKNTINRAQDIAEKNQHVLNAFDDQFGTNTSKGVNSALSHAQNYSQQAQQLSQLAGGKFNLKRAVRKAKNTVHKVGNITDQVLEQADRYGPMIAMGVPGGAEVMNAVNAAHQARDMSKMVGAGTRGGSFRVGGAGLTGGCVHCGAGVHGAGVNPTMSSLISPAHPAFTPKRQKPFKRLMYEN